MPMRWQWARQWMRSLWIIPCVLSLWLMGCQANPSEGAAAQPSVDTGENLTVGDRPSDEPAASAVPETVVNRVLQVAAEQSGASVDSLSVAQAKAETWSDGCLGLGGPAEICTMALVDGWWVSVTDGDEVWHYRTDATGQTIRQEPSG